MINKQSAELTRFYQDWLAWAEAPRGEHQPIVFNRSAGLCGSLSLWCYYTREDTYSIRGEMIRQFLDAGLNVLYPFGNNDTYNFQSNMGTMHECPIRLEWVRTHLEES